MDLERILPNDLEAERAVLGAILLHPPALFEAQEYLQDRDFYVEAHRNIFRILCRLQDAKIPIEFLSLKTELQKADLLEKCGGAVYLAQLSDGVPKALATGHYAKAIKDLSIRRRVIQIANETMTRAYEDEEETKDIIEQLQLSLLNLIKEKQSGWKKIADLVNTAYQEIERITEEKNALTGLDTGFHDLNYTLRGLHPQELIILAGRPSHGKTALAGNIVDHLILHCGKAVGVFELEMPARDLVTRSILSSAEIDSYDLPKLNEDMYSRQSWQKIHSACSDLAKTRLWIDDCSGLSIIELRARAQRLALENNIDLLVVDYLQLMSGADRGRNYNREREISEISRGLKNLAKDLNIPVLALSQLNRDIEKANREPHLSDLRESGSLEQDADVVLFIWREELRKKTAENEGTAKLIVAKQRAGRTRTIKLVFAKKFTKFLDAA